MTDPLKRLRELAEAATPGPYLACGNERGGCGCGIVWSTDHIGEHILTVQRERDNDDVPVPSLEQAKKNALYFAALSPEVVLMLLDRIDELEDEKYAGKNWR
jgi:Ead/Ea22-like protein